MKDEFAMAVISSIFVVIDNSGIAQSVEQRTVNPCVPGSNPGSGASNAPLV